MKLLQTGSIFICIILVGCSSIERLPPPDDLEEMGQIPGIPETRFWGDEAAPRVTGREQKLKDQITADPTYSPDAEVHFLALSGGGQKGAFGAGILSGWTATGNRPDFRMVTGISTGALLAPFAFLGPEYDTAMQDMYSKFSTKDVLTKKYLSGFLAGDSMADNAPLRDIVKTYLSPVEMDKIAEQHNRGRRLLIGTTYLDVQRPVIWDIGTIAASGHPDAYGLIIDILLASAAIPGAFPPVYFKVEKNGVTYDELHVDGGVTTQVFISPVSFNMRMALQEAGLHGKAHIYVIRNAQIAPEEEHLKPKTVPILTQSLSTLLRAQGLGDMYRIYQDAKLNGIEYHAAYMPEDFRKEPEELFDIEYMTELFELAYQKAESGYPWETEPPDFTSTSTRGLQ